ncbi:MAG: 50S ribosomal protein L21 [Bdellovibrionales bacterium]|nr:50S ribosomal protein L21 [Bdellovibrionales bacterium]
MYGVVEIKGHQYLVRAGDVIDVDKLADETGTNVSFDSVLFVGGKNPVLGKPVVSGAKVSAKVVKQDKARKLIVFKRRPGQYQKKKGHRTHYTSLLITEIADGQGNSDKIDAKSKNAQRFLKK